MNWLESSLIIIKSSQREVKPAKRDKAAMEFAAGK
jgi:hypothetical protein